MRERKKRKIRQILTIKLIEVSSLDFIIPLILYHFSRSLMNSSTNPGRSHPAEVPTTSPAVAATGAVSASSKFDEMFSYRGLMDFVVRPLIGGICFGIGTQLSKIIVYGIFQAVGKPDWSPVKEYHDLIGYKLQVAKSQSQSDAPLAISAPVKTPSK